MLLDIDLSSSIDWLTTGSEWVKQNNDREEEVEDDETRGHCQESDRRKQGRVNSHDDFNETVSWVAENS